MLNIELNNHKVICPFFEKKRDSGIPAINIYKEDIRRSRFLVLSPFAISKNECPDCSNPNKDTFPPVISLLFFVSFQHFTLINIPCTFFKYFLFNFLFSLISLQLIFPVHFLSISYKSLSFLSTFPSY